MPIKLYGLKLAIIVNYDNQAEFAKKFNLEENFVSQVIHGRRILSPRDQGLWAKRLNKPVSELFGNNASAKGYGL